MRRGRRERNYRHCHHAGHSWVPGILWELCRTCLRVVPCQGRGSRDIYPPVTGLGLLPDRWNTLWSKCSSRETPDLRSESGSRYGNGEPQGIWVGRPLRWCSARAQRGRPELSPPFQSSSSSWVQIWKVLQQKYLVYLHTHLLRHLRPGKRKSGVTAQFGGI